MGVVNAHEPVRIQTFAAELAVESFEERIVSRLAGPIEFEGDAIGFGPEIDVAGDEIAALVDANGLRMASPSTHPLQILTTFSARELKGGSTTAEYFEKITTMVRTLSFLPTAN